MTNPSHAEQLNAMDLSMEIANWVLKNFGDSELSDPSWNIESLAEHLAQKSRPYLMVERLEADMALRNMKDNDELESYDVDDIESVVRNIGKCDGLYSDFAESVAQIAYGHIEQAGKLKE